MPLGQFGGAPSANATSQELADAFARLQKEVDYLLNGGLDTLNVKELSADVINAGVLNAALVTIRAALTGAAYILINAAEGLIINDGTKNTFHADISGLVTMIGALIQSAAGYPKIELNSASNLFAAYLTAGDAIKLTPTYSSGPPAILFDIASATRAAISLIAGSFAITTSGANNLNLQSAQDASLISVRDVILDPTGNLKIGTSNGYTGSVQVVTSVNFGTSSVTTKTINIKKGIVTSVS